MERNSNSDDEMEVAANEDLLIQILLFLPPKSLLRFKSVSKAWLSLISSQRFRLLKSSRFRKDISGILLQRLGISFPRYDFLPLNEDILDLTGYPAFERIRFVDGEDELVVLQSCNGLLLCKNRSRTTDIDVEENYYVINPTTKEYTTFSGKGFDIVYRDLGVTLAFDPRKSINFKLICVCVLKPFDDEDEDDDRKEFDLQVYSLENGIVAQIGNTIRIDNNFWLEINDMIVATGVYWNDVVHWIGEDEIEGIYFNVDEEWLGKFPMPPMLHIASCWDETRWVRYAGESDDHFYLIFTECAPTTQLHVYEMDIGHSGWSLRFCIDLQPVFRSFPEVVNPRPHPRLSRYRYKFEIRGIVEIEKDGDVEQFLLLTIPGKIIRFNLKDESFTRMLDYATEDGLGTNQRCLDENGSFPIIESLHPL